MTFELKTFIYSMINFLLLVGLLSWLLYKPVRKVLAKRSKELEEEREKGEQARKEAEALSAEYQEKLDGIGAERREILEEGRRTAAANVERLLAEMREKVVRESKHLERELERTRQQALADVQEEIVDVAIDLAGKALKAATDEDLDEKLLSRFAARLRNLTEEERSEVESDARASVRIATAREADEETRKRIMDTITQALPFTGDFQWETDSALIAGLRAEFDTLAVDASLRGVTEAFKEHCGDAPEGDDS